MSVHPEDANLEKVKPGPEPLETAPSPALEHPKEPDFLKGVTVNVMATDGTDGGHQLSARELELVGGALELLRKEGVVKALQKVEANRFLTETQDTYLYLVFEGPLEFWAHVGKSARVNLKTGKVGVLV